MIRRMIVVTGGAGFIGSNIVARLCAEGRRDIVVCDRLETADLGKHALLVNYRDPGRRRRCRSVRMATWPAIRS